MDDRIFKSAIAILVITAGAKVCLADRLLFAPDDEQAWNIFRGEKSASLDDDDYTVRTARVIGA